MKANSAQYRLRLIFLALAAVILMGLLMTGCGRVIEEKPAASPPPADRLEVTRAEPAPVTTVSESAPTEPGARSSAVEGTLPVYELKISSKDLAAMERNAFSNQTVPGTFVFAGRVYEGVQVRYRGAWARDWPKKPVKIFFDKAKLFEGQRCLNLNSAWRDPAFVRESLAYHVYNVCGSPAPRSRMVQLNINSQFRGLYVQVEQPDQSFTKELKLKGAAVYKAASQANQADERDLGSEASFRQHYEKQTRKSEGYGDLQEFCRALAQSNDAVDFFNRRVELDKYINYLAATALTQNWDGFNKNHYLVHDTQGSGKWLVVPWDLDRTFGDHWNGSFAETQLSPLLGTRGHPGVTGWNRLEEKFFSNSVLRARFFDRLSVLLQQQFTEEKLFPVLDRLEAEIDREAVLDRQRWHGADPNFHTGIKQLKRYVTERRRFLLGIVSRARRDG